MTSRSHLPRQRQAPRALAVSTVELHHDLRQCLGVVQLLATVPEDDRLDAETRRRFDLIRGALAHATEMLQAATEVSPPRRVTVDLEQIARNRVSVAEVARKVRYTTSCRAAPLVTGDPLLLQRALDNMIDNAGRAAGRDGDVVVEVGATATRAWVSVSNDGPGFGEIEHGSGTGLSVVNSAARSCGGSLEISSGPGPGTTVRLSFPRHAGRPSRQRAEPSAYSSNEAFQSP